MRIILTILLLAMYVLPNQAQEAKPVYFESAGEGMLRFYFDDNYFLVDKYCEFKRIERLASFDVSTSQLIGSFTDFDNNGNLILEGTYVKGEKSGLFKAYHPNRAIKWEVNFVDNKPLGDWNFYYPDGKLMMRVEYTPTFARIMEYIDTWGRKGIENGNGRFEFKVPFQGYNPYGYPFVLHKGKLKNGSPDGYWKIYFLSGKQEDLVAEELYEKGGLLKGYDLIKEIEYRSPKYSILPQENFFRGEMLTYKPCTFDDISGYNTYLTDYLFDMFEFLKVVKPIEGDFEYKVTVEKEGDPSQLEMIKDVPKELSRSLRNVLNSVERYIPSFVNGEYIQDELTVKGSLATNEHGRIYFYGISISRKNES